MGASSPFPDASESFSNGFECGKLWAQLESAKYPKKILVHSCNIEQIGFICNYFGADYQFEEHDEVWVYLTVHGITLEELNG